MGEGRCGFDDCLKQTGLRRRAAIRAVCPEFGWTDYLYGLNSTLRTVLARLHVSDTGSMQYSQRPPAWLTPCDRHYWVALSVIGV